MDKSGGKKLRILMLEDVSTDAELIERELRKGKILFNSKRVDTREGFLKALKEFQPDLILADYALPTFDGMSALHIVQETYSDLPFIFVTGAMGEEWAIETLKSGATDYVLKDRLSRLVPAVRRALQEVRERIERKQAEAALQESEIRLKTILDSVQVGIIIVDAETRTIVDANPAMLRMIGVARDEVIGSVCHRFICPTEKNRCPICDLGRSIDNSERVLLTVQGEAVPIIKNVVVVTLNGRKHLVESFVNITKRKQAEEALRRLNEELEQRVEARTTELKEANKALQESLDRFKRAQDQLVQSEKMAALGGLVAGVAHEINTPLGVGVTAVSYLEQQTREIEQIYHENNMTRPDLEHYLKTARDVSGMILANLRRAADHIQSFKQIAVDQISEEKRRFKLKAYLEDVLLSLHPELKRTQHTVTIHCPEDLELESYPGVFSQIITNFVMNSLIHGFAHIPQGDIALHIGEENGTLRMRYRDNGQGISKQACARIFEPFYTTKRGQGGSGLGLSIVYNLVTQRLKGHIECESIPDGGTTFTIRIPMK